MRNKPEPENGEKGPAADASTRAKPAASSIRFSPLVTTSSWPSGGGADSSTTATVDRSAPHSIAVIHAAPRFGSTEYCRTNCPLRVNSTISLGSFGSWVTAGSALATRRSRFGAKIRPNGP